MGTISRRRVVVGGMFCLLVATGCSTSNPLAPKTRFEEAGAIQAAPRLGFTAADENVRLTLDSLILPNSPGTWLEDAPWDEYQISVHNLSGQPVRIDQVQMIDPRGVYLRAGMDPEVLESESERLVEGYKDAGISMAISAAPGALAGAAFASGAFGTALGLSFLGPAAAIAGPAYFFYRRHERAKDSEKIDAEFARRALPAATLAANGVLQGSAFFPIIPQPQALLVDYWLGTERRTVLLSLEEELAGLHVMQE